MPVVLSGVSSVEFTMTSDKPIGKDEMIAHLCVKGNASTGPGNEDFEITNWLDMSSQISGSAGAGNVYVGPNGEWGGTSFKVTLRNSYMSARINEIIWI